MNVINFQMEVKQRFMYLNLTMLKGTMKLLMLAHWIEHCHGHNNLPRVGLYVQPKAPTWATNSSMMHLQNATFGI